MDDTHEKTQTRLTTRNAALAAKKEEGEPATSS